MPAHEPKQPSAPAPSDGESNPAPFVVKSGGVVDVDEKSRVADAGASAPARETVPQDSVAETKVNGPMQPHRFRGYVLTEWIGAGGMGTVWKAQDALLKERVYALKVISRGRLAGPTLRRLFVEEMTILTKLGEDHPHPNIVQIRWHGESSDGELGFSMSYESGGDLAALVRNRGPLDPKYAADLVRQAAEAVEHAHRHDVIHCDLKPHNILLSGDGTPKVTDFGLARLETQANGAAASGEPVGAPSYMAPEQAEGRDDRIGRLTDVYGLGAVLYHLLTGRPPHEGATAEEAVRHARETPPRRPRELNPRIPRRLEAICLKCLQRNPGDRFASAGRVAAALQRYLRPWWKRHGRRAAAWAAVLFLCGLIAFWFGYEAPRRDAESTARAADLDRDQKPDDARPKYEEARFKYQQLLGGPSSFFDGADLQLRLARVQIHLGRLQEDARADKPDKTLGAAEAALEGLLASDPDRAECLVLLAEAHQDLGMYFDDQEQLDKAMEHLSKGLEIRKRLKQELSTGADFKGRLSRCYAFLDGGGQNLSGEEALERDLALSYGWLGDVQLASGADAKDARDSYSSASEIREASFTKHPTAKTLYLHARDFGNMANYYDRMGEVKNAIDQCCLRLAWYDSHKDVSLADLPQSYKDEPPGTRVAAAELDLDRDRDGSRRQAAAWLDAAEREYQALPEKTRPPISAELAQLYVVRAKLARAENKPEMAREQASKAEEIFRSLDTDDQAQAYDYYYWAVACAVRARVADNDPSAASDADAEARVHLISAFNKHFNHWQRLERDRNLLQPEAPDQKAEFERLLGDKVPKP